MTSALSGVSATLVVPLTLQLLTKAAKPADQDGSTPTGGRRRGARPPRRSGEEVVQTPGGLGKIQLQSATTFRRILRNMLGQEPKVSNCGLTWTQLSSVLFGGQTTRLGTSEGSVSISLSDLNGRRHIHTRLESAVEQWFQVSTLVVGCKELLHNICACLIQPFTV